MSETREQTPTCPICQGGHVPETHSDPELARKWAQTALRYGFAVEARSFLKRARTLDAERRGEKP